MKSKLLITGCNGLVGRILWEQLADTFELYGLDRHPGDPYGNIFEADIAGSDRVMAIFDQIPSLRYVVHLAGDPHMNADWESVLVNNIAGTKNIYEAARLHRVKRVIFASSNHVTGVYEGLPPVMHTQTKPGFITINSPVRPDGFYGVSKIAGEALARMYYDLYGIESICLRIGSVLKDDDPLNDPRHESTWLSHKDLVQLVKKSISADVKFGIYYGVSKNGKRFWDISNAMIELDYQPEDDASRFSAKNQ